MSVGYVIFFLPLFSLRVKKEKCARSIHIGVGFCVARSTELGNAKALSCGTSDRYRFPRFLYMPTLNHLLKGQLRGID